jgi:uncharacterized protein with PQ loop repeat
MGNAPVLQIRRMLREQSSRQVSLGYFTVQLIGFLLWIAYGLIAGILALVILNAIALLVGLAVIIVPFVSVAQPRNHGCHLTSKREANASLGTHSSAAWRGGVRAPSARRTVAG